MGLNSHFLIIDIISIDDFDLFTPRELYDIFSTNLDIGKFNEK